MNIFASVRAMSESVKCSGMNHNNFNIYVSWFIELVEKAPKCSTPLQASQLTDLHQQKQFKNNEHKNEFSFM